MDASLARALYEKFGGAIAFVEVVDTSGDLHLGSAFHIGDGLYATARHNTDHDIARVATVAPSTETLRSALGVSRVDTLHQPGQADEVVAVYPHPNENVDVALLDTR